MSGGNGSKRTRIIIVIVVAGLLASGAALWRWWQRPPEGVLVASGTIEATENNFKELPLFDRFKNSLKKKHWTLMIYF